ncbi:MAG: hypothetical protein AAGJ37_13955 [Pseudomonadota bacterium]
MAFKRARSFIVFAVYIFTSTFALAQQMDAQLNLAKRNLTQIESTLANLQTGDVASYNRISEKLTKTAELIKSSTSQSHPDYASSIQKWSAFQQQMVDIAQQWQQAQQNAQVAQQSQTQPAVSANASAAASNTTASSAVDADAILSKYQRQNRPKLANYPSPEDAKQWAASTKALQTTELAQDLALLNDPSVSKQDAQRVKRWIGGEFQSQINEDIQKEIQRFNSTEMNAVHLSKQILAIDENDTMKAYNFAKGDNGYANASTLNNGLIASAVGQALDEAFPDMANPKRLEHIQYIATAQSRFEDMRAGVATTEQALAKLPKKQKKKNANFLKGIEQELWYRGSRLAHLDKKGSIWMNSADVGDITSNGTIWVRGNDLGSIEPDGKVWFRGNHIGTLEENGEVWRSGTQVGLIESDGTVWIDGNSNGEIVPIDGEWKRAAVIYYFRDIFAE